MMNFSPLLRIMGGLLLSFPAASALDLEDLGAAEQELEELVADWQKEWEQRPDPASSREWGAALQALGMVERQAGKPAEALEHLEMACTRLSEDLLALADAREALALTQQDLGRLADAEAMLRLVLESRKSAAASLALAATCDHLAMNLLYQGRYSEVAAFLDEAELAIPSGKPAIRAKVAGHRGRLLHTLGNHARAKEIFEQALALPFQDEELRLALRSQRALALLRLGHGKEAREESQAVAEKARRIFSDDPLQAVPYLNNLGALALTQNDAENARQIFAEVVVALESSAGSDHPGLIGPLNNLGVAEQELGDYSAARTHLEQAAALQELHLPPVHLRVAETERNLARNALLAGESDARTKVVRATRTGMELLHRLIREGSEQERLNFLGRFDPVSLPCATGDAELIADVLIATKSRLLDTMLGGPAAGRVANWREIQKTLPPGSALVDCCRYTTTEKTPEVRYGAIVLEPSGPPRWVLLGSDERLGTWLDALQKRLRWRSSNLSLPPPPLKLRAILRALERDFWEPLGLSAEIQHVAFSPDGRLHFMPLAALLDDRDRPLSSRLLQIATVTSSRDLLHAAPTSSLSARPWAVVTISDFPQAPAAATDDPLQLLLADLQPMPGTAEEAARLRSLAPHGSTFLSGPSANELQISRLDPSPAVLHLGCHAFFLPGSIPDPVLPVDFDERPDLLFASGLVLYQGAERPPGVSAAVADDDLLFPSEIAQLPLRKTRLVTLSSCESGAGTPVSGEGLLGLRRAFSLAGAREIAVALWPVSDDSTPEFMERFYQLALASDRPAQALWQAQGEFLTKAQGEDAFETAVLRYAPFALSQNAALAIGGPIVNRQTASPRRWWLALSLLPLAAFIWARVLLRKSPT